MNYNNWIDQYPALANVKFGASAQTGGLPLSGMWDDVSAGMTGNASIADLGGLSTSNIPGTSVTAPTASIPGVGGGAGDNTGQFQLGMNIPSFRLGLQGLNTLGGLYNAFQQNSIAKDSLRFQKGVTNTNLNNQIKSYNTALEDRARSRAAVEGQSDAQRDAYVDRNRLSRS